MNPFPADDHRLKELILHVAARCGDWEEFDIALMDRILFQIDFLHFRLYGYPVTGQTYVRGIRSPAPENRRRITRLLVHAGMLEIQERPLGDGLHIRTVPVVLREADLRGFDGQEIAIAERVLRFYRESWSAPAPAKQQPPQPVSERSGRSNREIPWALIHAGPDLLDLPWELAEPGEEIPYCLALVTGGGAAPAIARPGPDPILTHTRQPLRLLERTP